MRMLVYAGSLLIRSVRVYISFGIDALRGNFVGRK